jgi:DeoR family transcriptional regulator, fructose operon transcriptional repressor
LFDFYGRAEPTLTQGKTMPAEARRLQIVDLLGKSGSGVVSVTELAQQLDVSEMTIRRDLDWLEQRSVLTRVHGGAITYQKDDERPFDDRLLRSNPQKTAIALAAVQLIGEGERIILDAGTTTQQVARNLAHYANLTVITNNLNIVSCLADCPHLETILLGGTLKHQEMCTVGPMVTQALSLLMVDKCILSVAGFDANQGLTDQDMREVEVKQAMMRSAREVILVADSSKWGTVKLVRVADLGRIDQFVTDDLLPGEAIAAFEAAGVEVITPQRMAARTVRNKEGNGHS